MSNETCNCPCCREGIEAPHEYHLERRPMPAAAMTVEAFEQSLGRCFDCQVQMTPCKSPGVEGCAHGVTEADECGTCRKALPDGCNTEFQGEQSCALTHGVVGTQAPSWLDGAMKLAEDYARAWQHDADGNYVIKDQAVKAKDKLRAYLAAGVEGRKP